MKKNIVWIIYGLVITFLIVGANINQKETETYIAKYSECLETNESLELQTQIEILEDSISTLVNSYKHL